MEKIRAKDKQTCEENIKQVGMSLHQIQLIHGEHLSTAIAKSLYAWETAYRFSV